MFKRQSRINRIIIRLCLFVSLLGAAGLCAGQSLCEKFDDVNGKGKYPYNFRIIDNCLTAGGSLFDPVSKSNSDAKVCEFLQYLKSIGVRSLMLLHVPVKDSLTPRLEKLCQKEDMELIKMRMNAEQLPTEEQTGYLMQAIASGSYVHCMWGCDRTGAIIGKYLRTKGYSGAEALNAIVNKGTHAGKLGGFKRKPGNKNLLLYFWPEVKTEAPEVYKEFSN